MPATRHDLTVPRRALAVGAHPDDVEFGAGATLAKWAEQGCEVSLVICTDGSKGTWDPSANTTRLVETRKREAQAAAEALGATGHVVFLNRVDGELENDRATRAHLTRTIRQLQPDVLLGHDPWKRYRLHPDHRAAGYLTCDALVAARDPHFFADQGIEPHRPSALLLFEADDPDHAETVEERHLTAKLAALESHRSQYESTMFIPGDAGGGAGDRDREGDDRTAVTEATERFRAEVRADLADVGTWAGTALAERYRHLPTDR